MAMICHARPSHTALAWAPGGGAGGKNVWTLAHTICCCGARCAADGNCGGGGGGAAAHGSASAGGGPGGGGGMGRGSG
eukprot:15365456-Alexandrium_andersonii.AAC.1